MSNYDTITQAKIIRRIAGDDVILIHSTTISLHASALLASGVELLYTINKSMRDIYSQEGLDKNGGTINQNMYLHLVNMGIWTALTEKYTKLWYQWKYKTLLSINRNIKSIHRLFTYNSSNRVGILNLKLKQLC